ncbi:Dabb family protein [Rhizobium terrae]|uniref:Dabb family protein n=1 Tax=Rhizobium terrae TaxID=2171756 RepID=UPI000E3B9A58|nr:Dabb family protein [Rhizobium terrae]
MIRHIVFFTAKPENIDRVRAGLSLLTENPHAAVLEIGTNMKTDLFGNEVDFVVYGEFEDEAALAAYKAHPVYRQSINIVRPVREMRIAADYDCTTAAKTVFPLVR